MKRAVPQSITSYGLGLSGITVAAVLALGSRDTGGAAAEEMPAAAELSLVTDPAADVETSAEVLELPVPEPEVVAQEKHLPARERALVAA
ncbi:MAG: hypothetical protein JWR37_2007 [Mycobacterium sp.]|nr:hypothetical protein [Mycobacterium sp.]